MSFWFTIREGIKGFRRARLATTLTITSVAFSHLLIGIFIVFSINVDYLISDLRSQMEFEVYLEPTLPVPRAKKIEKEILAMDGVASVKLISKEQAAKRFEEEFGKKIEEILSVNPLPSSCIVLMKEGFRNLDAIEVISAKISVIDGVDEVVYQKQILSIIDRYIYLTYVIGGFIGIVLTLISAVLLHNTIRITIYARRDIIEIMNLVGATQSFIKRPFLVEGFLQGLIGSLLSCGLLYTIVYLTKQFIYSYIYFKYEIFGILVILGVFIGLVSSRMSVTKHLAKM
jgi:cell division transport system permease protein